MKNLLYLFFILGITSCNSQPKKNSEANGQLSNGLPDARKSPSIDTKSPTVLIFNPKHGKPGHDCAIAEGAPLKSAQKQISKPEPVNVPPPTPVIETKKVAEAKTPSSLKLNPEHGKDGHRCDIAVGASLTAKQSPAVVPAPVSIPAPIIKTIPEKKILNIKTDAKLNPAHGVAGHRCEIAVGAPLT